MTTTLAAAIRQHLVEYLTQAATLDQFYDWLVGATWDAEQLNDPTAEDLSYAIKLPIAEYSGGLMTEEELRQALSPLVDAGPATVPALRGAAPHA